MYDSGFSCSVCCDLIILHWGDSCRGTVLGPARQNRVAASPKSYTSPGENTLTMQIPSRSPRAQRQTVSAGANYPGCNNHSCYLVCLRVSSSLLMCRQRGHTTPTQFTMSSIGCVGAQMKRRTRTPWLVRFILAAG